MQRRVAHVAATDITRVIYPCSGLFPPRKLSFPLPTQPLLLSPSPPTTTLYSPHSVQVETPQAASAADMRAAERRARIGIGGGRK